MRGKNFWYFLFFLAFTFHFSTVGHSQQKGLANLVYVDKTGVMRWTKDNKEAAFFGVNYTIPFAYGYRSHKALGVDLEKAIDSDVYHFARLGFDAFRVHVWDTEITDSLGNLKENEHLRLFDYLVQQLKKRKIKILLTPLAFWGNGYPQKDSNTGSFSSKWNKEQVLVTEEAIKAQEAYLQQFLKHVNPYTKLTYGQDPDVIALEINNEPKHTGAKRRTADYIQRMITAVKKSGWTKPIFYNISESPAYADVVANAPIEGVSFQWYPTGLVANRSQKGNYLPNVDQYRIPFGDTIAAFRNKARAVYEFDAGDVPESYLYPAMARSFRTAGFQWATQFAYDPLATAYGNTEYQTHYLNLAYTPSKAISLLIASKAFHRLPRTKSYGTYPTDTLFDVFRVSYKNVLSEMNAAQEFYYSNTTNTKPLNPSKLQHIAGVGSSPIINYEGKGAYFLDQIEEGVWRLEVMPDAILIRDPFEKASPAKEVTRIQWQENKMQLQLPGLGSDFSIRGLNEGNTFSATAKNGLFTIAPGTYLMSNKGKTKSLPLMVGALGMQEFVAPQPFNTTPYAHHNALQEVSVVTPFSINATIVSVDSTDRISVALRNSVNQWSTLPMQKGSAYDYTALVPADVVTAGVINYRIIIQKRNGDFFVYPGNHKGDPYAWDAYENESWQTYVVAKELPLELFNATTDRNAITLYNTDWRNNKIEYRTADKPYQLVQRLVMTQPAKDQVLGWELFIADKLAGRASECTAFDKVVIRARLDSSAPAKVKLTLMTDDAQAFAADIPLTKNFQEIEVPLSAFKKDSSLLLPRPYPGFLPLWFTSAATAPFHLNNVEKLQLFFRAEEANKPVGIQVELIQLQQANH